MKKPKAKTWYKVSVFIEPRLNLAKIGLELVCDFETRFSIKQLYFSRYVDNIKNSMEISCATEATPRQIKAYWNSKHYVLAVTVENRGSGSLAHAYAYQAVKLMPVFENKDDHEGWSQFLDVIHWMCNMNGYDYYREIRFYAFGAYSFSNQITRSHDEAMAKIRGDKAPAASAAKAAAGGRQSKRPRSAPAASRKGRG